MFFVLVWFLLWITSLNNHQSLRFAVIAICGKQLSVVVLLIITQLSQAKPNHPCHRPYF